MLVNSDTNILPQDIKYSVSEIECPPKRVPGEKDREIVPQCSECRDADTQTWISADVLSQVKCSYDLTDMEILFICYYGLHFCRLCQAHLTLNASLEDESLGQVAAHYSQSYIHADLSLDMTVQVFAEASSQSPAYAHVN